MDKKMFGFKSRTVSVVVATGLAVGIMATPAFADSLDTSDYVSAAARRAAAPAPEILGLSGVEECATAFFDGSNLPSSALSWQYPKYYLFGTSEYNVNPNPYMYNLLYGDANSKKIAVTNMKGSPNTTLPAYNSTGANSWSNLVWDLFPDVIIGNANGVDYNGKEYAKAVAEAKGVANYSVIGVNYGFSNYAGLITAMYDIADAGDSTAANTGKQLRYGSAKDIAVQYEEYILGTQGYILSQLQATGAQKKVVALITNYDKETDTYTLMESHVQDGTAASNRYLETVENVSTQLNTIIGKTTCTSADLDKCDLIMFGSQGDGASEDDMIASLSDSQKAKAYYTTGSNAGSCYGVTMNSVENAANIGRILGCLYPEYIDQDDFVAYYFDNFYHIKSDKLGDAMDNAMDGVVNWDATGDRTEWTAADADTYSEAAVQAKINRGMAYLQSLGADAPSTLAPSRNATTQSVNISYEAAYDKVTVDPIATQKLTGSASTPSVTVHYNGSVLAPGVEYEVEYSNNTASGIATATIKGKGAFTGQITQQFYVLDVDYIPAQQYKGSALTPALNVRCGDALLVAGKDYDVTYAKNDNAGNGYATATVTAKGDYECTFTTQFRIWTDITDGAYFKDLTTSDWGYEAIQFNSANGIMNGYAPTFDVFGTYDHLTRGQAALVLWRFFDPVNAYADDYDETQSVNETGKDDVLGGQYYTEAVNWAVANGIMTGYDNNNNFGPMDDMTREQLCKTVANAAQKFLGADIEGASTDKLKNMKDWETIDDWAVQAMAWCAGEEVINGVDEADGRYARPTVAIDRSTMAKIMYNAISKSVF